MFLSTLLASMLSVSSPSLTPCFVAGSDIAVSCTMLTVPRQYQADTNDTVEIHVIKASSQAESQRSPVFVLAGGPGQAATEMTHMLDSDFEHVRKLHDIVFVAQRGSGLSDGERCAAQQATSTEAMQAIFAQCRGKITKMEAQLSTHTLAQDIETTRIALGYHKIILWGGSYGTYVAQHYATMFPEQVDSMILDAVVPLNGNPLIAGNLYPQQSLDRLVAICQQDEVCAAHFPRWKQDFLHLLDELEEDPLTLIQDENTITLDSLTLAHMVRVALYSPSLASKLPLAISRLRDGDTRLFGALNAMIAGATSHTMYIGLTLGVLCQEHVYQGQSEQARRAGKDSFTQDSYYQFWLEACATERQQQADYITLPDSLTIPVLMISGTLDPITPEQSAQQALAYLPNAQHIIIPNAGHTNSGRGCMPRLLNEFLLTSNVADTQCITAQQFPTFLK